MSNINHATQNWGKAIDGRGCHAVAACCVAVEVFCNCHCLFCCCCVSCYSLLSCISILCCHCRFCCHCLFDCWVLIPTHHVLPLHHVVHCWTSYHHPLCSHFYAVIVCTSIILYGWDRMMSKVQRLLNKCSIDVTICQCTSFTVIH